MTRHKTLELLLKDSSIEEERIERDVLWTGSQFIGKRRHGVFREILTHFW